MIPCSCDNNYSSIGVLYTVISDIVLLHPGFKEATICDSL